MDTADSEIYNYDRSSFFRLLQSAKYRLKYEFIQQKQGLVVCPLKLNTRVKHSEANLIESHLFVPSPFYKNNYIPLSSLIALPTLNLANISNNSLPLDHSQNITLVLNNFDQSSASNELVLLNNNQRRLCKNVKLLNLQTAYTHNNKSYKILIVNRELCFKSGQSPVQSNAKANKLETFNAHTTIDEKGGESDSEMNNDLNELDRHVNLTFENYQQQNGHNSSLESQFTSSFDSSSGSCREGSVVVVPGAFSYRNSTFLQEVEFNCLNDVKTFGQSIDFMHSSNFVDENQGYLDAKQFKQLKKQNSKRKDPPVASLVGDDLINEIELLRKTYIILFTHLIDCEMQLEKIYVKYVNKFLNSARETMNLDPDSSTYSNIDLMVAIACENTIVGVLFSKLWPCILQQNSQEDNLTQIKCDRIRNILGLKLNQTTYLSNETIALCTHFFSIQNKYFLINTQPVLREFKRLSLLNNPFEKLECIKTSVELVTNELTILSSTLNSNKPQATDFNQNKIELQEKQEEQEAIIITSDILIPLIAFILIRSNINCFKSICYFIDKFQFSSRPNSFSNSHCSTRLDELAFFMTTFKAAVQFIETSY